MTILIAGGGIAGLTLALSLQQIGHQVQVFEAARQMKPLGVGINLQPNAVRELFDLGLSDGMLAKIGVPIEEWCLMSAAGETVHAEPRGRAAGYNWPQFAVHRGALQMLLYQTYLARGGAVSLGARASGFAQDTDGVTLALQDGRTATGDLLIGADGIHSAIRAQMHPGEGVPQWGGAVMYRGVTRAAPPRGEQSFVGLGTQKRRLVIYPISGADTRGEVLLNWIVEHRMDASDGWGSEAWFSAMDVADILPLFEALRFDWLDVPALLAQAGTAYKNPMIDRDPIPTWVAGRVGLMGDAAHPMYPTGSNGASQAIVDARVIAAQILDHGTGPEALAAYDAALCAPVSALQLRNRGDGPFGLLDLLKSRQGPGMSLDQALPAAERQAFMETYRRAAGLEIAALNSAPPILP